MDFQEDVHASAGSCRLCRICPTSFEAQSGHALHPSRLWPRQYLLLQVRCRRRQRRVGFESTSSVQVSSTTRPNISLRFLLFSCESSQLIRFCILSLGLSLKGKAICLPSNFSHQSDSLLYKSLFICHYRMTPNVSEFLSVIGVSGPLTSSMIATARCFSHPNFKIQVFFKFYSRSRSQDHSCRYHSHAFWCLQMKLESCINVLTFSKVTDSRIHSFGVYNCLRITKQIVKNLFLRNLIDYKVNKLFIQKW